MFEQDQYYFKYLSPWEESLIGAAREALGKLGDARAVEPLVWILGDIYSGSKLKDMAAEALSKLGDAAVEPLVKLLKENKTSPHADGRRAF
jgi:HEAT repeat protein